MKAFTQLCKKANFSLHKDVITVYYKPPAYTRETIAASRDLNTIQNISFLQNNGRNHSQYHCDDFSQDLEHRHLQFPQDIDENKLKEVLAVFSKNKVISIEEEKKFILSYRNSNLLQLVKNEEKISEKQRKLTDYILTQNSCMKKYTGKFGYSALSLFRKFIPKNYDNTISDQRLEIAYKTLQALQKCKDVKEEEKIIAKAKEACVRTIIKNRSFVTSYFGKGTIYYKPAGNLEAALGIADEVNEKLKILNKHF